jgi:F0F1-type ATP synthase delta subunit
MKNTDQKLKFVELRGKGYSYDKISTELNVNKSTLLDWGRDLEDEIQTYKSHELENLLSSYLLVKEHRLKSLGTILGKLQHEMDRRDLGSLATDKLLELYLKYDNQIKVEVEGHTGVAPKVEVVVTRRESGPTKSPVV